MTQTIATLNEFVKNIQIQSELLDQVDKENETGNKNSKGKKPVRGS